MDMIVGSQMDGSEAKSSMERWLIILSCHLIVIIIMMIILRTADINHHQILMV